MAFFTARLLSQDGLVLPTAGLWSAWGLLLDPEQVMCPASGPAHICTLETALTYSSVVFRKLK